MDVFQSDCAGCVRLCGVAVLRAEDSSVYDADLYGSDGRVHGGKSVDGALDAKTGHGGYAGRT